MSDGPGALSAEPVAAGIGLQAPAVAILALVAVVVVLAVMLWLVF